MQTSRLTLVSANMSYHPSKLVLAPLVSFNCFLNGADRLYARQNSSSAFHLRLSKIAPTQSAALNLENNQWALEEKDKNRGHPNTYTYLLDIFSIIYYGESGSPYGHIVFNKSRRCIKLEIIILSFMFAGSFLHY